MNKGRREGQGERANNNKEFSYVFVWCLFRSLIGPKSGQNPKKKKHPNLQPHKKKNKKIPKTEKTSLHNDGFPEQTDKTNKKNKNKKKRKVKPRKRVLGMCECFCNCLKGSCKCLAYIICLPVLLLVSVFFFIIWVCISFHSYSPSLQNY